MSMLRESVSRYWPVLLLLAVACVHAYRVGTLDQTPWKGGGFGMFSTLDGYQNRFARIYVNVHEEQFPLSLEPQFVELVDRFVMAPTSAGASRCLNQLGELRFRRASDGRTVTGSLAAAGSHFESDIDVTSIELEYWVIDFDAKNSTMTSRMVRRFKSGQ